MVCGGIGGSIRNNPHPAMALQGPFLVVADRPAPVVLEALRAAGGFPIIESTWADAATAVASVQPEAVVLADSGTGGERAAAQARALSDRLRAGDGPFTPVIARIRDDGAAPIADALSIAASAPAARIPRRLSAALRLRTLHGTVLRRTQILASRGQLPPAANRSA